MCMRGVMTGKYYRLLVQSTVQSIMNEYRRDERTRQVIEEIASSTG